MNLQFHLLSRIAVVALMCLSATVAYLLCQSDRQARSATQATAESLVKQLEFQLFRIHAASGQAAQFPDFDLWKQTGNVAGICLGFVPADGGAGRSICKGPDLSRPAPPNGFESFYRRLFSPGYEIVRPIAFNGRVYGLLTITPSAEMEIARAWDHIRGLFGLSRQHYFSGLPAGLYQHQPSVAAGRDHRRRAGDDGKRQSGLPPAVI